MSHPKQPPTPGPLQFLGTPRGTQLVVAGAVLLCVGAVVVLALWGGDDSDGAAAGPTEVTCEAPPTPPAQPKSFTETPDAALAEGTTWEATVTTNCGDITFELYGDQAPQTVASFLYLAEQDYWVDSPCHRLTKQGIFVLQCGDPTGTGGGDPGYGFGIENAPTDGSYPRGTLAMARTADPNSNGGQFFIVYDDTALPTEGGGYSIFGEVTGGMEVVDEIVKKGLGGDYGPESPAQPISILDISAAKA
ncbi:MAG: peptidylprolyl isomerase [Nocardioidaceae bacterium]|nr:peptidylprolyl isomerase [Nocardioidaceae bacterium]